MGPGTQDGSAASSTDLDIEGICQESKEPRMLTDLGVPGIFETPESDEASSDEQEHKDQYPSESSSRLINAAGNTEQMHVSTEAKNLTDGMDTANEGA